MKRWYRFFNSHLSSRMKRGNHKPVSKTKLGICTHWNKNSCIPEKWLNQIQGFRLSKILGFVWHYCWLLQLHMTSKHTPSFHMLFLTVKRLSTRLKIIPILSIHCNRLAHLCTLVKLVGSLLHHTDMPPAVAQDQAQHLMRIAAPGNNDHCSQLMHSSSPCKSKPGPSYTACFVPQKLRLWASHQGKQSTRTSSYKPHKLFILEPGGKDDENKCKACLWSWRQQSDNITSKYKTQAPWLTIYHFSQMQTKWYSTVDRREGHFNICQNL